MSTNKPIVCVDFDGVIHSYLSGWQGADVVADPPVEGAIAWLEELVKHFTVAIFSSRSNAPGGVEAMQKWLFDTGIDLVVLDQIQFPKEKPPAHVTLDDRALTFTGVFPSMEDLKAFKPWYKK